MGVDGVMLAVRESRGSSIILPFIYAAWDGRFLFKNFLDLRIYEGRYQWAVTADAHIKDL